VTDRALLLAGFPPAAYLIGAQKAGTTSLAGLLAEHPDLTLSRPKEPDFYTGRWNKGLDWYRSRFPDAGNAVLLDASTSYSMAPVVPDERSIMNDVPRRIFELRPDARFIYIVRDPVDRAISAYWHAVRNGDERRPIQESLTEDSMYLRASRYAFQLERYLAFFSKEQFLVLTTSEFAQAPRQVLERCWYFLGLDAARAPATEIRRRNESYIVQGVAGALMRLPGAKRAAKFTWKNLRKILSDATLSRFKSSISRRPPDTSVDIRAHLGELLGNERESLKRLIEVDIP
jgi:hypothetical protein